MKDSTTTTGAGTLTLSGTAPAGYQSFNAAVGTGVRIPYTISTVGGTEWEVGLGSLATSTTLVREQVLASSNAGALVSLSSGTKDVYLSLPAEAVADIGMTAAFAMRFVRN